MNDILIVRDKIELDEIKRLAQATFGDMVKAVVDVEKEIMAVGGELHADAEALLLEDGSKQVNLWGFNIYPEKTKEEWLEYDSMVNIKPGMGNRSRNIDSEEVKEKIAEIVKKLIK
ncbi:MAG: DUF5674 family protein [Patescibacteria group bacterium]|nr:DUF5674 family protein [Patescibacteria group bacterium]